MKARLIISCVVLIILTPYEYLFGYNGPEHHRFMGERAAEESDLGTYLRENLGLSKGIDTKFTNPNEPQRDRTKSVKEWIGYGGIKEDAASAEQITRSNNHFYDPVTGNGLSDGPQYEAISSQIWGREHLWNNYSWTKAREYYYLALTSETKEERERYWALTFRSLGQVLHLVQDLASPAHVRNDNHGPVGGFPNESLSFWDHDPYEDTWGTSREGIPFIHAILAHGALGNADYQYPAVQLDQFEDYWDTEDDRGLAEFTNSNFVSKDTNLDRPEGDPHHYDNPQGTGEYRELFTFTDSTGTEKTIWVNYVTSNVVDNYAPGRSVNPFNYLTTHSFFNFYTEQYDLMQKSYTLNRKCHEEYAKLLVPRTVGYGAGLLNYFFRGRLETDLAVIPVPEDFQDESAKFELTITPVSEYGFLDLGPENFEIYVEDPDSYDRYLINDVVYAFDGEQITARFDAPEFLSGLIVIYRGTLGEEEVIIGKRIMCLSVDDAAMAENFGYASVEDNYLEAQNEAWGEYLSGLNVEFTHSSWPRGLYEGVANRIIYFASKWDSWDARDSDEEEHIEYSVYNGARRGYYKFNTEHFSSISNVKIIALVKKYNYSNIGYTSLDTNCLVYSVDSWPDWPAPLSVDVWSEDGELEGKLIGELYTGDIAYGIQMITMDLDAEKIRVDTPTYLEWKTDIEDNNYTPISTPEVGTSSSAVLEIHNPRSTYNPMFYLYHFYLFIEEGLYDEGEGI